MTGVAVVTGGGGGIGRETARQLAGRGEAVSVWDLSAETAKGTADLIAAEGGRAIGLAVDVTDQESVREATAQTVEQFGAISVLVTGAGYSRFIDFLDLTLEDWHSMLTVHATGTFLCAQAVAPSMISAHYGRMVFLSSLAGLSGSAGHVHYGAAKAAILGFAKALAKELGPEGIMVNALTPGSIDTPMLADIRPEIVQRLTANPVGRVGVPHDVARAVLFLTAPDSDFITGTVLGINGGAYT